MEYKFRAWDIESKYMMSWEEIQEQWESEGYHTAILSGDHYEPMLYSGLPDKNGIEICVGDIVDKSYTSPLNGEIIVQRYVIKFDMGQYKMEFISNKPYYDCYLFMSYNEVEIIGNIYENEELLQ